MSAFISWLIQFVLKGFGVGAAPDPTKAATDTGEKLGKAESAAANSEAGEKEIQGAIAAQNTESGRVTADHSVLFDPGNRNSRGWKPGDSD